MAGRRTSLASLAGAKVEDVPGRSDAVLLSLPLDKLHCTRFNPRRNFGTEEELREFGEKLKKEQLQPAVVVSRTAYLKLWPNEADRVGLASYVIANGERRYRASRLVGRPALEVVHREDVAKDRATFLDAVQSENNDRQDLDPIERAIAIETMVTELGGADQVATYYGKTKGWVSQQRKLLKLAPELQDLVSAGEMPVRVARDIASLPPEAQPAAWSEHLERRRLEKEAAARLRAQAANPSEPLNPARMPTTPSASETTRFTAVNPDPAQAPTGSITEPVTEVRFTAVNRQPEQPQISTAVQALTDPSTRDMSAQKPGALPDSIPEPRDASTESEATDGSGLKLFPYHDGLAAAHLLLHKMPPEERAKVYDRLGKDQQTRSVRLD
ncbi:ParB N-terminal domain-containing protein [Streptomyces sp. NPDC049099]|uniref:ParB/RepB/Spo0J family partition protein n=1 Tax=Streptomyces sp. NPDC049099 TaxID=3155768 RepID=UPI003447A657